MYAGRGLCLNIGQLIVLTTADVEIYLTAQRGNTVGKRPLNTDKLCNIAHIGRCGEPGCKGAYSALGEHSRLASSRLKGIGNRLCGIG